MALARCAPKDKLIHFRDPLNVGPLGDVDGTGAQREAFWERAYVGRGRGTAAGRRAFQKERDQERATEDAAWERLLASAMPVVAWHGPHAMESLLALRVAALLNGSGRAMYEVVRSGPRRSGLPTFYNAVAISRPDELAPLLRTRTAVTDFDARAQEWARVCAAERVCFRELADDGAVIGLPEDGYDERLISNCSSDWSLIPRVIGRTMGDTPVGDLLLAWRLRELVSAGVLEVRGEGPFGPGEVRLTSRSRRRRARVVRLPR